MTLELYAPTVDTDIPRLVVAALKTDAELTGFFTSIELFDYETLLDGWRPTPPCLLVVPGALAEEQMTGDPFYGLYDVGLVAYLHPQTPITDLVAAPGPPGATVLSAGRVEPGVYHYGLTGFGPRGESSIQVLAGYRQISPALAVSALSTVRVTYPSLTGWSGFRLWRTRKGGRALYFHSVLTEAGPFDDNLTDAELAEEMCPIKLQAASLVSRIRQTLKRKELLTEAGRANAKAALRFRTVGDGRRPDWNVRFVSQVATYALQYDSRTRQSTVQR